MAFTPVSTRLALAQRADGLWSGGILRVPHSGAPDPGAVVGTAPAVHRLLELGWEREAPPFQSARRPLFRLLAEDTDPAFLYDLSGVGREPETVAWARGVLRGAAAAALAHAGYERDPRLRGAAMRMMARIYEFLESPLAEDPWTKVAGAHALAADACPPSHQFLVMLAFMPEFRNEHDDFMERLLGWLSRPVGRHASAQVIGSRVIPAPYLVLGDPLASRQAVDGDVPFALYWLEMVARLGMLDRHEGWKRLFERFLDDRDRDYVWRPSRGHTMTSSNEVVWPFADLQGQGAAGGAVDTTFRLGLIAKCAGRSVEFA